MLLLVLIMAFDEGYLLLYCHSHSKEEGYLLLCKELVISYIYSYNLYFLKQIQAGLSALKDALQSGYEDFKVMNQ
jgi:hypothetical protein